MLRDAFEEYVEKAVGICDDLGLEAIGRRSTFVDWFGGARFAWDSPLPS
jgi:hypothetical protein